MMGEPAQATIKEAAEFFNYGVRTVQRMIERRVLPSTGKGALRRIPWTAIRAKYARMQEGEPLWQADANLTTKRPPRAAKKAPAASGRIDAGKRGTPTSMNTGRKNVGVRVQSEPPSWFSQRLSPRKPDD
jgi:excisionase family DNA binding protein